MSAALEVAGVSHRFGQRAALSDVSITVERGHFMALLGPNGAGKTTLVRILATLLPLDGGAATVAGHDVVRAAREVRAAIAVETASAASVLRPCPCPSARTRAESLAGTSTMSSMVSTPTSRPLSSTTPTSTRS